jgi:hypothetical protein
MTYINRDDVISYVGRTMPNEDLSDFDTAGIADDVIAAYPHVIGEHDLMGDSYLTDRSIDNYLDDAIDSARYWDIVARHDRTALREDKKK